MILKLYILKTQILPCQRKERQVCLSLKRIVLLAIYNNLFQTQLLYDWLDILVTKLGLFISAKLARARGSFALVRVRKAKNDFVSLIVPLFGLFESVTLLQHSVFSNTLI